MTLLKHRIQSLRLRENAPFPSEVFDAQESIRNWRHELLVRRLSSDSDSRRPDYCGDFDMSAEDE
jgi:hypothetical protein